MNTTSGTFGNNSAAFRNTTWDNTSDVTDGSGNDNATGNDDAYLYELGGRVFVIVDALLVLFGCLGNILTFLVATRKRLRSSPVSVFIAALAVFDTVVLVLDFLNNWLEIQLQVQPLNNFEFCVFYRWFFNVAYTTSAWLVAGVAVERLVAVWFPLTAKIWCTVKNSIIATVVIFVVTCLFYINHLWMWREEEGSKCRVAERHSHFMNVVSPWFSAVLYSYLPLLVIIGCSVAITVRLVSASQHRATMTSDTSSSDDTKKVTITVMSICVAFVCLTVPLTVWYIWVFATEQFSDQAPRIFFIEIIILIVALTNHSINFFLYVLTSERFRSELREMLCSWRDGKRSDGHLAYQLPTNSSSEVNKQSITPSTSISTSLPSVSSTLDLSSKPAV